MVERAIGSRAGGLGSLVGVEQAEMLSELFETAVTGPLLLLAGGRVFGQQQASQLSPVIVDRPRVGLDGHSLRTLPNATGCQHPFTDVDHAHATDTNRFQARVVAQRGNLDSCRPGRLPDRCSGRDAEGLSVDCQFDHGGVGDHVRGTSSGKCSSIERTGIRATWPSPQIEVCSSVWPSSGSSLSTSGAADPSATDSSRPTA